MYNTQSSGSPIAASCKTGRKITETLYYAAGLGKSASLLGSSWENEADGASQPCAGESGSGCWDWARERLTARRRARQACWMTDPTCQRASTRLGPWTHKPSVLQICRKITYSRDFNPKSTSICGFFSLLKSYHYMGISLLLLTILIYINININSWFNNSPLRTYASNTIHQRNTQGNSDCWRLR